MACFRVKYNIEYDNVGDLYRLPKAPELIKIANDVATDVFFDTASDNDPIWVDISTLEYDYGGQIFLDVANEKNGIFTSSEVTGDCLTEVYKFINNSVWLLANGFWNDNGVWRDDANWID